LITLRSKKTKFYKTYENIHERVMVSTPSTIIALVQSVNC
jgi:hypothetical protein